MPNPSLKLSPNGVAHWACGAGASPQFCAAVPARHTVEATLARTLGPTKDAQSPLLNFSEDFIENGHKVSPVVG
jgi:hypothetical protein